MYFWKINIGQYPRPGYSLYKILHLIKIEILNYQEFLPAPYKFTSIREKLIELSAK